MSEFNLKPELLALLLHKSFWEENKFKVIKGMFPEPFDKLYTSITKFHDEFQEDLDKNKLYQLVRMDFPTLTDAQKRDIAEIIEQIKEVKEWTPEFAKKVLSHQWKEEVFREVTEVGLKGTQGIINNLDPLENIIEKYSDDFLPVDQFAEVGGGIDELISGDANETYWKFNLASLQDKLGSMHTGHFLQIMARPDVGKTGFVVSLVAGPDGYAKQGATVDYYGNEEPVKRTRWRMLSAWTGLPKEELEKDADNARALFLQIQEKVRTFEIPFGTPVEAIAQRTRKRKPDIVIVDQVDKLSVSPIAGNFQNDVERLRVLYIKYREIAKRNNCLVVGLCQASADAEGQRIVTYDQAEGSKTGKAAECDVFLGIGRAPLKENVMEEDYTRWITASKAKLDNAWKGTVSCKLNPKISRFEV